MTAPQFDAPLHERFDEVLTDNTLGLVGRLHEELDSRRVELLGAREERQAALEEALLSFAGCAVIISHDRWFLDRIATHVLAFEGDSQVVWFEGNF